MLLWFLYCLRVFYAIFFKTSFYLWASEGKVVFVFKKKCIFHLFHSAECTFEDPGLCGWTNMKNDDLDWTRANAGTATFGTGPQFDHTYGTTAGAYSTVI